MDGPTLDERDDMSTNPIQVFIAAYSTEDGADAAL
jgi:hypothetical protein